ncbi:L,D-transpeptidase family protein [Pleionea sediminis]|uniref:L,D-transpeptidase family protein n=1 Tax=Pleionea sediminis TaxID=2569479 RepID=UPI0013DDBAF0|nr:murein L,D-transpeptidase family protein [Pleionea sediminis]
MKWLLSCLLSGFVNLALSQSNNDIPTSARSTHAIAAMTPVLEKALANKNLTLGAPVYLRVFKKPAILEVWVEDESGKFRLFKDYKICAFSGDLGPKLQEGDFQSPEGFYWVNASRFNPWSKFHLSFNIGFPNAYDRHHGRTGSALMIHGQCVSIGCYAMTDPQINEIYTLANHAVKNGQRFFRVHIFPFRLSEEKLIDYKDHRWYSFWSNLKEGYDWFENHKRPPNVSVKDGLYSFEAD